MALEDMMGYTVTQTPPNIPGETMPGDIVSPWGPSPVPLGPPFQAAPPSIPEAPRFPVVQPHPNEDILQIAATHTVDPEVKPIIQAIESGVADKKFTSVYDQINEALDSGDEKKLKQVTAKLTDVIHGDTTWGEDYVDSQLNRGAARNRSREIASHIIINAIQQKTGLGAGPKIPAQEAVQMGLMTPEELTPGSQVQQSYGVLRDDGFGSGVVSPTTSIIPGVTLSPFQQSVVGDRRTDLQKGRTHADPAGLQEFNIQLQALVGKHIEQNGTPPNKAEFANLVAQARGQFEKAPVPGSLKEDELRKGIQKIEADTKLTQSKTTTEDLIRPHQITETQAKVTSLLARAKLDATNATDAVRKGDLAQQQAEISRAHVSLGEMKSQMQALVFTLTEGDLGKADRVKLMQMFLDLAQVGAKVSKEAPFLGLDIFDRGAPNVGITKTGEPGTRTQPTPAPPPPIETGVDPFAFAPKIPGLNAPPAAPQLPQQTLPPLATPPRQDLSQRDQAVLEEMNRLKKAGLSKEEILHLIEKKFGKAK